MTEIEKILQRFERGYTATLYGTVYLANLQKEYDFMELVKIVKKLTTPIVTTSTFENECELYVDTETDEWVLKHKGVIKKRAKSKFECLLTKQELKKRLGV